MITLDCVELSAVLLRKWLCIVNGNSIWSIVHISEPFLTLIWVEGSFLYSFLHLCILSENNWRPALWQWNYCSSACDLISSSVTKQWLDTIPIIQPSKFESMEVYSCQFLRCMVIYGAKQLLSQHSTSQKPGIVGTWVNCY